MRYQWSLKIRHLCLLYKRNTGIYERMKHEIAEWAHKNTWDWYRMMSARMKELLGIDAGEIGMKCNKCL